jgi:hypothetical protein
MHATMNDSSPEASAKACWYPLKCHNPILPESVSRSLRTVQKPRATSRTTGTMFLLGEPWGTVRGGCVDQAVVGIHGVLVP